MSAIRATHLTKRYRRAHAVDDVSFEIQPGEIVGFLGPNGAGKTTTLRMLAGLVRPTAGEARILGARVPGPSLLSVGTMIEEPSFYPYLSGWDNLRHTALLHGALDEARIREVLAFVRLEDAARKKLSAYSQGMRQRLGLARALLSRPKVLLLDEPTNGLDPVGIAEIRENLREVARGGVTILISSHILAEIEKLVERVLVIEQGKLLFDGPLRSLTGRLEAASVTYVLAATDLAALRQALRGYGYTVAEEAGGRLSVQLPEADAAGLLARLASDGHSVTEARRREASLEDAYLRLVRADQRPA
ncbi:ABC transporter ATP-binding protein [Truepera radiovictrix]|uniref:ABC transporter related protein n=1 Tax=Truepera radiovictrix (strain DSM 17093 / CIP 108686 / LMG 22925 / RQ-24) TaxID=649638 RepID=D7CSU7_TRURR|nr:ABC transporter ATP-binding protein [Truepera radiovictrix]ADI13714.1 ABC transporter related protein [Truepera radiovictrix DSM 17093]WMT57721.1 ABC transporter ATP-binding protein [Truepera radiovictrix]